MHQMGMMLLFSLFGFVLGAHFCVYQEFQCGSGECIDLTERCDGFPDCFDASDEEDGCGAECVMKDLKKFLNKEEPVKAVYRNRDIIRITCPMDPDYGYDYNSEQLTTNLTCYNGSWLGYIPQCISITDSNIKSTPKAGSESYTRLEFGNARDDEFTPGPDFSSNSTTVELYANKAECQINGLSQYLLKNQLKEKTYRHAQKIIISCPTPDDQDYDYGPLFDDSHSELTCHDGQWIGSYPQCFKSCTLNVMKDFLVEEQDAKEEYQSGETISVSCSGSSSQSQDAHDYQKRADNTRNLTCINGKWVGEYHECFEPCKRSSVPGNLVMETGSEYFFPGDVVQIKICWGNIPVQGDGHLTCMANGSWYGNATCPSQSVLDCFTPPDVQNAFIIGNLWDRYPVGSVITYKCGQAYWLRGNNKLTCVNGKWTGEQFICEIRTCLYPGEIENGQILNITVEVGQYMHFSCDEGYILKGPSMMLCYADGNVYSEMAMPSCEAVQCQPLKPPEHGWIDQSKEYDGTSSHEYGSYVMMRCEEGYQLSGTKQRHCQADGTWSGVDAICQRKHSKCYRIPEVPNAMFDGQRRQWYVHGTIISYNCVENYILTGINHFTCADGSWMGGDFNCTRPVCDLSQLELKHGRFYGVERMIIVHGDSVSIRKTVKCDDGYSVPPNMSYVSCYNGTIDPPNFDCVKYDDSIKPCHLSKNEGTVIRYRDKCYLVTKSTFTYRNYNAKTFCQNLGPNAQLATIPDKETNEAIRYLMNMVPAENKYWFGAMWNGDNSRWEWPNGTPLNYTNWMKGEGDLTANIVKLQKCAILTFDGRWEDTLCWNLGAIEKRYKAICEIAVN